MVLPGGGAGEQIEQAVLAEEAGWDGVFVWEAAYGVDAWGLLTAIAARTTRIRLGTMLTPLPWRRPWKVASQVATLDQISGGRATLAVGLGATETDLPRTGEELDLRTRAAMLDEGIDLIRELWAGRSQYHGVYYDYSCPRDDLTEVGRPVQERIPIWVVGAWPRPKSMRRVLRCDGVLPQFQPGADTRAEMRVLRTWLSERSTGGHSLGFRGRDLVAGDPLGDATSLTRADAAGPYPNRCRPTPLAASQAAAHWPGSHWTARTARTARTAPARRRGFVVVGDLGTSGALELLTGNIG
jgi:alkanesulfonate monooxygenase SsuD/methylene tetrahydromethanopterin reductase-like flavin-dependent oxidoreductase (luciferase family)